MPLKLKPPRPGKTPFYYVRGTYLGIRLDRSTQTSEARAATVIFKRWKSEIERGKYHHSVPESEPMNVKPTFASAALAYIQAGGERAFLSPIIEMTGESSLRDLPLADIDQMAIDRAAATLYPNATAQTRNRQFYTPVSAVLKRAGIDKRIQRPRGWRGKKSVSWLEPEQAFALFAAARSLPRDLENARKAAVITAHTVWLPTSSCPVSQQPSRKKPVMGLIEQTSSRSPNTLRGVLGRPPPLPLSSLSIYSPCAVSAPLPSCATLAFFGGGT